MESIRIRPLTEPEERYLRKNEGESISFPGPLSVMGHSNHAYVRSTVHSDQAKLQRVYLDAGQYFDELVGCPPAPQGILVPINWSATEPLHYLNYVATNLGVPIFSVAGSNLLYFNCKYERVFADCIAYVDKSLANYDKSRSLWGKFFGSLSIEWQSREAEAIRNELMRIIKAG